MLTFIGCSGFYYREWKGQFYPHELPSTKWLQFYAQHFNSIEINASFYKMPTAKGLAKWYNDTPREFALTVKAPRLFTHYKRMRGILEFQSRFYDTVFGALQDKLCCVLYQFPATEQYSVQMLEVIMTLSEYPVMHAIEFRHASWWREDVYAALQAAGLTFVNISFPGLSDMFVPDGASNYLRFHGKPVLYKSGYGSAGLEGWIQAVKAFPPQQLFVYFNNTWFNEAIEDAKILQSICWDGSGSKWQGGHS